MFWSSKKFLILIILLNIGLMVFGTMMFINIKNVNENVSVVKYEIDLNQKREDSLESTLKMLADSAESLDKINSYFVKKDGEAGFIGYVENVGRQAGIALSVDNVSIENSKDVSDFKDDMKMRVAVAGEWGRIIRFLGMIENMPFAIIVNATNISSLGGALNTGGLRASRTDWSGYVDITVPKLK